jgi:hypothetical protein
MAMRREDHLEEVFTFDIVIDMEFCDDVKKTVMSDDHETTRHESLDCDAVDGQL